MSGKPARPAAIHATALVAGEWGLLLRGAPGAGKSRLAQALIAEGDRRGLFARLVADDRVRLSAAHGRLIARAHPAIAGLIEQRGAGVLDVPHEPAARLSALIDISDGGIARFPEHGDGEALLEGVLLPRLALQTDLGPDEGARRVLAFLHRIFP